MTDDQLLVKLAPYACLPCRSKKRKCDRILPTCSRCQQISHPHYYCRYPHVGSVELNNGWILNSCPELQNGALTFEPLKSRAACQRCREGKRRCSRALPQCSRCKEIEMPCVYDRPLARVQSAEWLDSHHVTQLQLPSQNLEQTHIDSTQSMWELARSLLTIDRSGYVQLDPFQTYPSSLSPDCISRILTYSIREMWPKLFPGFTYKGVSFVDHWVRSAMSCPPLFNAWLHSGAGHMQMLQQAGNNTLGTSTQDKYEMLLMEREAILGLKEIVERPSLEKVTDEIVMSALALALHPPERKRVTTSPGQQAPLANLQLLSHFTDIVVSEAHVRGLYNLVDTRGGFDKLEMPGLKQGLSSFSLIVASKYLARPLWPIPTRLQREGVVGFLTSIEQGHPSSNKHLHSCLGSVLPGQMSWEFYAVQGYNNLLKGYSQGLLPNLNLGFVLELRNTIHYHVLSLPALDEIVNRGQDVPPTYGALRLSLIAYSLIVLFPVPLTTEPYPRLAHLLRCELEVTQISLEIWIPTVELLLWVMMLGGIAALGTVHRAWYVGRIQWLAGIMGIESWAQLKNTMVSILWMDSPCDVEGLTLWEEVQTIQQLVVDEEQGIVASYIDALQPGYP